MSHRRSGNEDLPAAVTVDDLARELLPQQVEELVAEIRFVRETGKSGTKVLAEAKISAQKKVVGTIAVFISIPVLIEIGIRVFGP